MGSYHKSENTFHFLTYKEQIKQKVRLSYRRNDYVDDDTLDSYFATTLENWTHLNKSCAFSEFRRTIAPYVLNLKLVLLHKDELLCQLKKFIVDCNEVSSGPILDLLSALSCDLREDFYPYFAEFFGIVKDIITEDHQDADVLNHAFNCISHLVYFLHRCISKDIDGFLRLFTPLLVHKKDYIRQFSAGCMAFVLRKVQASDLIELLFKMNKSQPISSFNICGTVIAEVIRSLDGNFHSSSVEIFPCLFAGLAGVKSADKLKNLESDEVSQFCRDCLIASLKILSNGKLQPEALVTICKLAFSHFDKVSPSCLLTLISTCDGLIDLLQEKRFLYQYESSIEKFLLAAFAKHASVLSLAELVIKFVGLASDRFNPTRLVRAVLIGSKFTPEQQITLMTPLLRHKSFEKDFSQILSDVLLARSTNTPIDEATLNFLARLVLVRQPPSNSDNADKAAVICLSLASGHHEVGVLQRTARWITQPLVDASSIDSKLCAVVCLPKLSPVNREEAENQLWREIKSTSEQLKSLKLSHENNNEFKNLAVFLCACYEALFSVSKNPKIFIDELFLQKAAISTAIQDVDICAVLMRILDVAASHAVDLPGIEMPQMFLLLRSPSHTVRLLALKLIRSLLSLSDPADSLALATVERCLQTESIRLSPTTLRDFQLLVLHMHSGRSGVFGSALAAEVALNYLIGLLHVNLTPAWESIVAALSSFANPIFYSEAADSAIQPDVEKPRRRRNRRQSTKSQGAIRSRSRSPMTVDGDEDAEKKSKKKAGSYEVHKAWTTTSRQLFWRCFSELLQLRIPSQASGGPTRTQLDELASVAEAYVSLLVVVPDNDDFNSAVSTDLAPEEFPSRRPVDWKNFRLNMWRSVQPEAVGNHNRLLVQLFLSFVENEFYPAPNKVNESLLGCILSLFSRIPNLRSVKNSQELETAFLKLLANKRPTVQQAAFNCWIAYAPSGLSPYKEHFEKILNLQTFRDAVRVFKLDSSVVAEHRAAVARVLIRILYGRLHLSKENLTSAVFTNLAGCSDEELAMLLSLIVESFLSALGVDHLISSTPLESAYACVRTQARPDWSRLHAICNIVERLLSYMGHRMGGLKRRNRDEDEDTVKAPSDASLHTPTLFHIAILMISAAAAERPDQESSKSQDGESSGRAPHSKQVKVVRKTGIELLLHLSSAPGINLDAFWTQERVAHVQSEVLANHPITAAAVASPGHLALRLASVWSQSGSEYLVRAFFDPPDLLLAPMVDLLQRPKTTKAVARIIVEVVTSLIFSEDVQETGRVLLKPFHPGLIEYLYHRFLELRTLSASQARKALNSTSAVYLQREFRLLGYLSVPPDPPDQAVLNSEQASRLLSGLLPFLVKALSRPASQTLCGGGTGLFSGRNRKVREAIDPSVLTRPRLPPSETAVVARETTEAEVLRVLCRLIEITDQVDQHLSKVMELFSTVESRISRALLCSVAGAAAARVAQSIPEAVQPLTGCLCDVYSVKPNLAAQMPTAIFNALRVIRAQHVDSSSLASGAGFEKNVIYKLLCMLNSWSTSHLDMVDAVQREAALNALLGLCELSLEQFASRDRLHYFVHLAGVHSALYTLQTAEIQLRDLALDYILQLAKLLAEGVAAEKERKANKSTVYHQLTRKLIITALWPGLVKGLKQSMGPRRLHFLRLLTGLVKAFAASSHPFFAPLALLTDSSASEDQPVCFFTNIQSGTATRQLYAIRRLTLFLSNPLTIASKKAMAACPMSEQDPFVVPLAHLRGVFLPILLFFLRQEMMAELSGGKSLGQESRKLVASCLEAVRALASRMLWVPYRELLAASLSNLEVESSIPLKYTLAILDGYQPCEEAVPYMLTVVSRLQAHIIPTSSLHGKGIGGGAEGESRSTFTYLRTNAVVALVTLLRRLPKGQLETHLPHLVLKVIDLLRPSKKMPPHARQEAVQALSKVAIMVGPGRALDNLFSSLARELGRGYNAMVIRLDALNRIFFDLVSAIDRGGEVASASEASIKSGALDNVVSILLRLYLDEVAGRLAEELDSRWDALHKGSSTDVARSSVAAATANATAASMELPEARGGPKAPNGLPALLRFCSPPMLVRVFKDLSTAASLVSAGKIVSNESLQQGGDGGESTVEGGVKSDEKLVGQLRFRKRSLARLQAVFERIPTRHGLLHPKMATAAPAVARVCLGLVVPVVGSSGAEPNTEMTTTPKGLVKKGLSAALYRPGWSKAATRPLEKRPDYLAIPAEPKLSAANPHATQTDQAHVNMLAACGLNTFINLVNQGLLSPTTDSEILADAVPAAIRALNTCKALSVLAGAVRCIKLFMHLKVEAFEAALSQVSAALFNLVDKHSGLLTSRASAKDASAQSFAYGLYATLAAFIKHQINYSLSPAQLTTLFLTIETEVVGDCATSPVLALLAAFLSRRLRHPHDSDEEPSKLSLYPNAPSEEKPVKGFTVSKATDKDVSFAGAGGGPRLSNLMLRIQRLIVTSTSETVRRDCRRCLLAYLLNYPHQRRFVVGFIGFLLRQLEYTREMGRASVSALLSTIVAEFPVPALVQGGMEETILLAVGAAVEREVSVPVRLALYGLIRLLFTRIPEERAVKHFQEYFMAFLRAPADSRMSARLLGLQMVAVVLDAQDCLSIAKHRQALLSILGASIFPDARKELTGIRGTNPHLFREVMKSRGGDMEMDDLILPPQVGEANPDDVANDGDEDGWQSADGNDDIRDNIVAHDNGDDEEESIASEDEDLDGIEGTVMDVDAEASEGEKYSNPAEEDADPEPSKPEAASAAAVKLVETCINVDTNAGVGSRPAFSPAKSATELHFALTCCSLEHGLRLTDRLLTDVGPEVITSSLCGAIWKTVLCVVKNRQQDERETKFATLLLASTNGDDEEKGGSLETERSLLLAPTAPVREWAARVANRLLRVEVANQELASPFFTKCKNVKTRLTTLLNDSLHQLEIDSSTGAMSEEYSNTVLSNLICLGQLLHRFGATKQVLRVFRTANRLSLDELNNRKNLFNQRIITLKLTVGLLLKLPRPTPEEISALLATTTTGRKRKSDAEGEEDGESSVTVSYLRSALRLLARESKQRERLAFLATSSIPAPSTEGYDDPAVASHLASRLAARLGRVDSARAKARRRKAQGRLRRALLSGEMSAQEVAARLAGISMVEVAAADNLIELIESSDKRLASELLGAGSGGISALYAWSARGLAKKREARATKKAVRSATGDVEDGALNPPLRKRARKQRM